MKKLLIILSFLMISPTLTHACAISTHTFEIDVDNTVTIVTSGNLSSILNTSTGVLNTGLNINYNITTNQALSDIGLRALIRSDSSTESSFYCDNSGSSSSQALHLVFTNNDNLPTVSAINDCKQASSTAVNNANAIAYPGTLTISRAGSFSYKSSGYFACQIPSGKSSVNMSITTTPKSGTYSTLDAQGVYQVEIYLDNIPS